MNLQLGQCPVSWGVEEAEDPRNVPWTRYLDEAAAAGYHGVELGPLGYLPGDRDALRGALRQRGLRLCAGYVMEPLSDRSALTRTLERARRTAAILAGAGAEVVVVIDDLNPARAAVAGRGDLAPRLGDAELEALLEGASAVAGVVSAEFGLAAAFHHHVGTHVEFRDEIDRLLAGSDPDLLGLCVDSGHAVYAGIDPVELFGAHAARVRYMHLKDVDASVLARVEPERLSFGDAVAAGMFCPLGRGEVDFPALFEAMRAAGYDGWASIEQDRMPSRERLGRSSFEDDARASFQYVREAGWTADRGKRGQAPLAPRRV